MRTVNTDPFPRLALDRHVAAHHPRELAADGEPEPCAAELLRGGCIGLAKFLKQLRLLLERHADAGVGDGQLDEVAAIAHPAPAQRHLALFGEFASIAQEVE